MKSDNSLTSFYYEPPFLRSTTAVTLIIAFIYILFAKLSFLIHKEKKIVSPICLPAGFSLASVLILGKRSLLGICLFY